jgi:hypothetical protein
MTDRHLQAIRPQHSQEGSKEDQRAVPAIYRDLVAQGFDPDDAADLTAWLIGIPGIGGEWTTEEIAALIFLHELERFGRQRGRRRVTPGLD